jgi:hypothetical protein
LNENQKSFFQQEDRTINKHPDETYSHLIWKPLTKYLVEANHIQQKIEDAFYANKRTAKKIKPHWNSTPELQKIAEHLKEKQKIICYLRISGICVFFSKHDSRQFNPTSHLKTELHPKYILLFKTWRTASRTEASPNL